MLYNLGPTVAMNYETTLARERWTDGLDRHMLNSPRYWQAQLVIAITLDICIFVLLLPVLRNINTPNLARFLVMAVFSLSMMCARLYPFLIPLTTSAQGNVDVKHGDHI